MFRLLSCLIVHVWPTKTLLIDSNHGWDFQMFLIDLDMVLSNGLEHQQFGGWKLWNLDMSPKIIIVQDDWNFACLSIIAVRHLGPNEIHSWSTLVTIRCTQGRRNFFPLHGTPLAGRIVFAYLSACMTFVSESLSILELQKDFIFQIRWIKICTLCVGESHR